MSAVTVDRAPWLEWRRGGIGASDVAGILGLSRWSSPWSVWASKVGLLPEDEHDTEAMEFGRRAEVMIAPWFHERTGLYLLGEQAWASNPAAPWMQATLDGHVGESPSTVLADALGAGEIKCTRARPEEWENEVPVAYQVQACWQAAVTGHRRVWFLVLHLSFGIPQFRVYELDIPEADVEYVTTAAEGFWRAHVLTGEPPDVDAHPATTAAVKAAYGRADEAAEPAELDELADDLAALRAAKAEAKEVEETVELLSNRVRVALADRESGQVGGLEVVTWKHAHAVNVPALIDAEPELTAPFMVLDLGAFVKAHKKVANQYRTELAERRFLLKKARA